MRIKLSKAVFLLGAFSWAHSMPFSSVKDFCMSDPFPCQETAVPVRHFEHVHSQLGCAERCSQHEECQKWTWYKTSFTCLLYDNCPQLARNQSSCGCFTAPRCYDSDKSTTPTLIGDVETVEVLLKNGPSTGVVSDFPEMRQFPVVASIGDKVFLCGGTDASGTFSKSTCFFYWFTNSTWIEMDQGLPNGPLSRSAGVAAFGDLYILGGQAEDGEPTRAVEILNGVHPEWYPGPPMPESLSGHCAIRDWDLIYVIGSSSLCNNNLMEECLKVFLFNITTWKWKILATNHDLEGPRRDFACALSEDKKRIFVSGGKKSSSQSVSDFLAFSIEDGGWEKLANSLQPRSGHVMTLYRDQVTIIGGLCADNEPSGTMESFENGLWRHLNETLTRRKNFRVTLVPSAYFPQN